MNKKFSLAVLVSLISISSTASATIISYDLSGISNAPVVGKNTTANSVFQIDWSGATLTHDTGTSPTNFSGDKIRITGQVRACVGAAGQSCFNKGDFARINNRGSYYGSGTFEFRNVEFALDGRKTQSTDDIFAQMDRDIGDLVLVGQTGVASYARKVDLSLKANPALGYAFRLFDQNPVGDGLYQIFTWIMTDSWLYAGIARSETRPGESVFNGNIFACRQGTNCGGGNQVPEPMTFLLLGSGLAGAAVKRRKSLKS
jgi:PEP-CTERM motif